MLAAAGALVAASPGAQPLPPSQVAGVPIPEGQIEQAVDALGAVIADVMDTTGIPGLAVAVVHDGRIVLAEGFGVRRAGEDDPVTPQTVFQIASLSKPVGATVVAHQVGEGSVSWDTPVATHLPWFELADPWVTQAVTIGDLYAHRAGLPGHIGDDLEDLGFDRRTILERLRHVPLGAFRDTYAYTNFGITAAAEAVAAAAGTDWESLSESALYAPLGMTRTSSRFADFMAHDDRAAGHVSADGRYQPLFVRQPDAQTPAGGVSSSVEDVARWMRLVLGDGVIDGTRLVSADALLPAVSPQAVSSRPSMPDARASFYGFGFGVGYQPSGRVMLSHSGAFAMGWSTNIVLIPSANVGIVTLTNAAPTGAAEAVGSSFADLVQFGETARDWLAAYQPMMAAIMAPAGDLVGEIAPANPAPARPLSSYAGRYENRYFGPVDVRIVDEGLQLSIGPEPKVFALRPWSGDRFVFDILNENAAPGSVSAADFVIGESADRATQLRLEFYDHAGLGAFEYLSGP